MTTTLDAALEALRRLDFYAGMAAAERELRSDETGWAHYIAERDSWLDPDVSGR